VPEHNLRLSVVSPSESLESGGTKVQVNAISHSGETSSSDTSSVEEETPFNINGKPDVSVLVFDDPSVFVFIGENKQQLSGTWKELTPGDTQAGQLLQCSRYK